MTGGDTARCAHCDGADEEATAALKVAVYYRNAAIASLVLGCLIGSLVTWAVMR